LRPRRASEPNDDAEIGPDKEKALEAAGNAKLVPNEELESLNAKMHVSRCRQLTPYGDPHGVLAETKAGLDQVVRERAYLLLEQAGRRMDAPTTSGIKRSMSGRAVGPTAWCLPSPHWAFRQ
jgi:hypothetical protein